MSYIGTIKIGQMYLGGIKIGKAYLGGTLVFSGEIPVVIVFEDPNVEAIAVAQWGNGTTLTERQAAAVTTLGTYFRANTAITSFNELEYFTGLTKINGGTASQGAFYGCTALEEVTLPSTVTEIQARTFYECSSLTSINLSNVTSIGDYAFYGASLSGFTLNCPNLSSIGAGSFTNTSIMSVTSLGTITSIPNANVNTQIFKGCTLLTSIVLPTTLQTVGHYALYRLTGLTSVTFQSNVTTIGQYAFQGCSALTTINIPSSVTSIGTYAFGGCTNMTGNFTLNNLTSVAGRTFSETGITGVSIASATVVGSYSFYRCRSLTYATLSTNLTTIEMYAFEGDTSLATVNIPSGVTTIGTAAFYGCSSLIGDVTLTQLAEVTGSAFRGTAHTSFTLSAVVAIRSYAFYGNSALTTVDIGSDCTTIETYAMGYCSSLATVIVRSATPPSLTSTTALSNNANLKIWVPNGTLSTYQGATNWSTFASKMYELDSNGNIPV